MNYTKGVWATDYRQDSDGMYSQDVFDERGETIAVCAWHRVKTEDGVTTDREANARLIAAAPEMYKAIRTFIQRTERAKGVKFSASMMGGFIAMKKALAKAEGG